ncbi:hypothetical protein ES705_49025 [subsurface metagenome]
MISYEKLQVAEEVDPVGHSDRDEHDRDHCGNRVHRNLKQRHQPEHPNGAQHNDRYIQQGGLHTLQNKKQRDHDDQQHQGSHSSHVLRTEVGESPFDNGLPRHVKLLGAFVAFCQL